MRNADYLRSVSLRCLELARNCFDLATASKLNQLGGELRNKATEMNPEATLLSELKGGSSTQPPEENVRLEQKARDVNQEAQQGNASAGVVQPGKRAATGRR